MAIESNFLTNTRFTLTIDGDEFKDIVSKVVDYNHPSVTSPQAKQAGRQVDVPHPGSKLRFEPLVVKVQLDNKMDVYESLYNWMVDNVTKSEVKLNDLTLTIYNMNENPTKNIRYLNAFPVDLGTLSFTSTDQNDTIVTLDVTFAYSHFELVNV